MGTSTPLKEGSVDDIAGAYAVYKYELDGSPLRDFYV